MSNSLIDGYTTNNENRTDPGKLFPLVDILAPDGTAYASLGTEPFTPNNELLYKTYQLQDNLTRFSARHSLTFGFTMQRYEAENSFFNCCKQGAYVYNSLADFAAELRLTSLLAGHDPLARADDDDAQAAEHPRDVRLACIDTQAGLADALEA